MSLASIVTPYTAMIARRLAILAATHSATVRCVNEDHENEHNDEGGYPHHDNRADNAPAEKFVILAISLKPQGTGQRVLLHPLV